MAIALVGLTACSSRHKTAAPPSTTASTSTTTTATSTIPTTSTTAPVAPGTCPPVQPRAEPRADRPQYTLGIDVRPQENAVQGTVSVRFTPDQATNRLVFRLWPNGPREAGKGAHLDTGPVTVDGHDAPVHLDNPTTLVVPVTGGIPARHTVEAALPWRLTFPGPVRDRVSRSGDAMRLGSFFPILPWEPGVGWDIEPPTGEFAEASTAPHADFTATVTVPAGFQAIATGVKGPDGTYTATAVPDFALSVGHFSDEASATVDAGHPVEVTVAVADGLSDGAAAYLAKITRVMADLSRRFGPFPWPAYTVAITPDLAGGIEYPMHTMQGPNSLGRTTSHELSHQWFYALVADDQGRDPWLDEGLASWGEAREEHTEATFGARTIPAGGAGHGGESMTYWASRQSIYYASVYAQPVKALLTLGDPNLVDCALRLYASQNAHHIARPADLFRALTAVFPDAVARLAPYGLHP